VVLGHLVSLAVLGAGNAGCSLAGELTLQGHDVSLAELPEFKSNLELPMRNGGIEVTGELKNGFAKVKKITFDVEDAIRDTELIFVTTPAFGHEPFTRACAPHLKDGQTLIYISYFGALRMARLLLSSMLVIGLEVAGRFSWSDIGTTLKLLSKGKKANCHSLRFQL